jgi:hypothetical protein
LFIFFHDGPLDGGHTPEAPGSRRCYRYLEEEVLHTAMEEFMAP